MAACFRAVPEDRFPAENLARLRALGCVTAPLPRAAGGLGWAVGGAVELGQALQAIGMADVPLGRIYEAHVNAIALVGRYANATLQENVWNGVRKGDLLALWVAPSAQPLTCRMSDNGLRLQGTKPVCTAAGFVQRAVVTAHDDAGREQMLLVDASGLEVDEAAISPLGAMRSTHTRPVRFDVTIPAESRVGDPGDYLREPDFSAGAWRTSAVTAGGLHAMVAQAIAQLRARGRHTAPAQSERIGRMLIAAHTASLWANACAERTADPTIEPAALTAFVNLARVAIEQACLDTIPLVQRSLGFASLLTNNPMERMMRDLALYLRQPAADEALAEAAVHFAVSAS